MAHFAQLDENNIVTRVLAVDNKDVGDLPFPESEPVGVAFLQQLFPGTQWVQTSYNDQFRARFAGVGHVFDASWGDVGGFRTESPFPSWTLDPASFDWVSPIPMPDDGKLYMWRERDQMWVPLIPASVPVTTIG
jgi:hypothetical protein